MQRCYFTRKTQLFFFSVESHKGLLAKFIDQTDRTLMDVD
jgi:hypothetical protein